MVRSETGFSGEEFDDYSDDDFISTADISHKSEIGYTADNLTAKQFDEEVKQLGLSFIAKQGKLPVTHRLMIPEDTTPSDTMEKHVRGKKHHPFHGSLGNYAITVVETDISVIPKRAYHFGNIDEAMTLSFLSQVDLQVTGRGTQGKAADIATMWLWEDTMYGGMRFSYHMRPISGDQARIIAESAQRAVGAKRTAMMHPFKGGLASGR